MQQPSPQLARDILGMMQPYPHAPLPPPYHRMSHAELRAHVAELDAAELDAAELDAARDRAKAEAKTTARAEARALRAAAPSPTPQVPSLPAAAAPVSPGTAPPTPAQLRHGAEEVLMGFLRDEGDDDGGDREDSKRASLRLRAAIATLSYLDRRELAAERAADRALKRRGKSDFVSHFSASENEQVSEESKACQRDASRKNPPEASRKNRSDGEPSVGRDAEASLPDVAPPALADTAAGPSTGQAVENDTHLEHVVAEFGDEAAVVVRADIVRADIVPAHAGNFEPLAPGVDRGSGLPQCPVDRQLPHPGL